MNSSRHMLTCGKLGISFPSTHHRFSALHIPPPDADDPLVLPNRLSDRPCLECTVWLAAHAGPQCRHAATPSSCSPLLALSALFSQLDLMLLHASVKLVCCGSLQPFGGAQVWGLIGRALAPPHSVLCMLSFGQHQLVCSWVLVSCSLHSRVCGRLKPYCFLSCSPVPTRLLGLAG